MNSVQFITYMCILFLCVVWGDEADNRTLDSLSLDVAGKIVDYLTLAEQSNVRWLSRRYARNTNTQVIQHVHDIFNISRPLDPVVDATLKEEILENMHTHMENLNELFIIQLPRIITHLNRVAKVELGASKIHGHSAHKKGSALETLLGPNHIILRSFVDLLRFSSSEMLSHLTQKDGDTDDVDQAVHIACIKYLHSHILQMMHRFYPSFIPRTSADIYYLNRNKEGNERHQQQYEFVSILQQTAGIIFWHDSFVLNLKVPISKNTSLPIYMNAMKDILDEVQYRVHPSSIYNLLSTKIMRDFVTCVLASVNYNLLEYAEDGLVLDTFESVLWRGVVLDVDASSWGNSFGTFLKEFEKHNGLQMLQRAQLPVFKHVCSHVQSRGVDALFSYIKMLLRVNMGHAMHKRVVHVIAMSISFCRFRSITKTTDGLEVLALDRYFDPRLIEKILYFYESYMFDFDHCFQIIILKLSDLRPEWKVRVSEIILPNQA